MKTAEARLVLGNWSELQNHAAAVRQAVFVTEQGIPQALEWDTADAQCLHAVIFDGAGEAIATGRLLPDGHIGRMAVLPQFRRHGLGGRILEALVTAAAERGHSKVVLSAQVHALSFYRGHGFETRGGVYDDVGIPHQDMVRTLGPET
jgi:predicted GNAT family N-acyltransferase